MSDTSEEHHVNTTIKGLPQREARKWDGETVNLTTHPGDKTGEGNETHLGVIFLHLSGKPYALLARRREEDGFLEGVAGVFLSDIATIEKAAA